MANPKLDTLELQSLAAELLKMFCCANFEVSISAVLTQPCFFFRQNTASESSDSARFAQQNYRNEELRPHPNG